MEKAVPMLAYGASKAATKFLTRKLHFEHEKITCFTIHPGYVLPRLTLNAGLGSNTMFSFYTSC